MPRCLIGLGTNLGDRSALMNAALARLAAPDLTLVRSSSRWRTIPVGGPAGQGEFLNAAAVIETTLEPEPLLTRLLEVESQLGRTRGERWAARTIDLDLLLYDQRQLDTPRLTLPHPRLAVRWFAVAPAAEIAGDWVHPQLGWTLARLAEHLAQAPNYVALCELPVPCPATAAEGVRSPAIPATPATLARLALEQTPGDLASVPRDGNVIPSASEAIEQQLEVLGRFAAADYPPQGSRWLVSDFWTSEPAAWAEASGESSAALDERLRVAPAPRPKLVVAIARAAAEREALWAEALERRLRAADVGPVLRVEAADPPGALRELVAALRAMPPHATL